LHESSEFEDVEEYLFNVKSALSEENEASKILFLLRYE
jgi:hypothetical protein